MLVYTGICLALACASAPARELTDAEALFWADQFHAALAPPEQCLEVTLPPAQVERTIDGDTFILYHVGVPPEERVRVLRVNAFELRDSLGPVARAFTVAWLARGPFTIRACKRDSFGRLLAIVWRVPADTLASDIIAAHLGVPYP